MNELWYWPLQWTVSFWWSGRPLYHPWETGECELWRGEVIRSIILTCSNIGCTCSVSYGWLKASKMIRACNSQQISSRTYSDWKFISSMFSLQSSAKPTPGHREGCTEDASVKRMVKPMVPLHGNSAEKRWIPTVLQWLSKVQQVPDKYLMPSVDEITKCLRMSYYTLYYIGLAGYYWRFCLTLLTWANL